MLYHKDLFIPKHILNALKQIVGRSTVLKYSRHAIEESLNERLGLITLPKTLKITDVSQVFEIETNGVGHPIKICVRQPHNDSTDIVIVLALDTGTVKTVWLNKRNDSRSAIDWTRYSAA